MHTASKYKFASREQERSKSSWTSQRVNFQKGTEVWLMNLDACSASFLCLVGCCLGS